MGNEEAGETAREGGGRASSFPLFSFFISNGGSTCCPRFFSFRFERGQHLLPPCLFISFRTGAASAAPVSFLFISNGGSIRCPCFFSFRFERGQHTLPPFLSISNGGGVQPTCRHRFFRLPPVSLPCSIDKRGGVKPTRHRRFFRLPPPNNRGVSPCLPPNHGGCIN